MHEPAPPGLADVDGSGVTPVDREARVSAAFQTYHGELYNFLRRGTRDEAAAEDLLQDAFLRLAKEIDGGRAPDNIRAWLYRVAANLVVSRARRRKTVVDWIVRHGRSEVERGWESPEATFLRGERSIEVDDVLAMLAPDARAALLLSSEGFNGEEIAQTIGRSHGATRTLISRARVKARLELERREGLG